MANRVTLEDIARSSNASVAAVSLALRNKPGVSRERRERILSAALALGYERGVPVVPHTHNQGRVISLLIRSSTSVPALDRFYTWVVTGVQDALTEKGMTLVLGAMPWDEKPSDRPIVPTHLFKQRADGWLIVGSYPVPYVERIVELARAEGIPVVLVDDVDFTVAADAVGTPNARGGQLATEHLISRGHRDIAFIGLVEHGVPNFDERYAGYREAMSAAGLPQKLIHPVRDFELLHDWANAYGSISGLVAANDWEASRTVRTLLRMGIRIPDDVSIIGFDDTDHAVDSLPEISTIRVDKMSMGRLAVGLLEYRWAWPDSAPVRMYVDVQLVQRDSVRDM